MMVNARSLTTALAVASLSAVSGFSPAFTQPLTHQIPISPLRNGRQSSCGTSDSCVLNLSTRSPSPEDAMRHTASQLERMQRSSRSRGNDAMEDMYRDFIQMPASALKSELQERRLLTSGRKPDLARRLAAYELQQKGVNVVSEDEQEQDEVVPWAEQENSGDDTAPLKTFCGMRLSESAGQALGKAKFRKPTPIQAAAIPRLVNGESLILHAETGTGKSLAYLLPITETLWKENGKNSATAGSKFDMLSNDEDVQSLGVAFILTPTRELAAQIAGVATVLAPPQSVRLVSHPSDLASYGRALKDRVGKSSEGIYDEFSQRTQPRIYVGSAKAIMASLYGDGKMPASPTRKPQARKILQSTKWVVLDEVDRLLQIKSKADNANNRKKKHEKPAAIIASAVTRLTIGKAQVIAASATVGRPLKRELSRVLGLSPQECPEVVRGEGSDDIEDFDHAGENERHQLRAVTIPDTVRNYVIAVDTSTVGKLLTNAFFVIKTLNKVKPSRRMLLVLTKGCDISTQNTVAALQHFNCEPEPRSLLDALEAPAGGGTDQLMQQHRLVSGATGIGESYFEAKGDVDDSEEREGYLFVTGEDTVRGLHLDGLDVVIVVGRPKGPDEYMHIAGRTGRAGRPGMVINVVSEEHEKAVKGWETMLSVDFEHIKMDDIKEL